MISLLLTIKTIDSMRKVCFLMGIAAFALLAPSGVKAGNDKNAEIIYSVTDAASSVPVPPLLLKAMALRIQDMDDPSAENVATMIEDEVSAFGLKRVSAGVDLWIYAKNAEVKTANGETDYVFKSDDAFVLNVIHAESSVVELKFKNKAWCDEYKKAFLNMDFISVPYFEGKRNTYMQPGNFNRLIIEDDDVCSVCYQAKYFVEPVGLSPYDVISAIGEPAGDLLSLAETRGYTMADSNVNEREGNMEGIFLSKGCKLSKTRKGVLKIVSTSKYKDDPYDYVQLTKENDIVKGVFQRAYHGDPDEFIEALISQFYIPDEESFMYPVDFNSGYSLSFNGPEGKRADLRYDSSGFVTLQIDP